MADEQIIQTIHTLIEEEHAIRSSDAPDKERLDHLEVQLDQCWDLLRQRRARRDNHLPDTSDVRDEKVVEGYQQ